MSPLKSAVFAGCFFLGLSLAPPSSRAFPHVVGKGETLAMLSERYYGRIALERVLVAENHLDRLGIKELTPGMLLEIPTLRHHRVRAGETWESLALEYLGGEHRGIFLAEMNGLKPWIQPELGLIVSLPHQLSLITTGEESFPTLSYRFLGSTKQAYLLSKYNDLDEKDLKKGGILLVPLMDLPLTTEGRTLAAVAAASLRMESEHQPTTERKSLSPHLTDLTREVKTGRYVQAVAHGEALLESPILSAPEKGQIHKQLLTAYVALEAENLAKASCEAMRKSLPEVHLDAVLTSPKILALCPEPTPELLPPPATATEKKDD